MTGRWTSASGPVVSSKVPNASFHDRTRSVMLDQSHPASRHSMSPLCTTRQCTSALTRRTLPASDHSSRQRPVTRPRCMLTAATDRTLNPASGHYTTSVRSLCEPLSFLSRASVAPSDYPHSTGEVSNPCSNVPTTKCITLCTCVSIFL